MPAPRLDRIARASGGLVLSGLSERNHLRGMRMTDQSGAFPETLREAALWEALKTYGQHRVGCPHPSCPDCRTHTMAASKTPGYSYCTRCGRGSIPTSDEACDCGFEAALERPRPAPPEPSWKDTARVVFDALCAAHHPTSCRKHADDSAVCTCGRDAAFNAWEVTAELQNEYELENE
jgi:ribosomal protein L37E